MEVVKNIYRTHTCGELNINNVGDDVKLSGWVQKIRDLGGSFNYRKLYTYRRKSCGKSK